MPIKKLRNPSRPSTATQATTDVPQVPLLQQTQPPQQIPPPQVEPPMPSPANAVAHFTHVTYRLPDGGYLADVIQCKFIKTNGIDRLLMVLELDNGTQFLISPRLPLSTDTPFGSEIYKHSDKGVIIPSEFIGAMAVFDIVNKQYSDKTYSRFSRFKLSWNFFREAEDYQDMDNDECDRDIYDDEGDEDDEN